MEGNKDRTSLERFAYSKGYSTVAGIDEVGRGPLAGPVVAAAVILDPAYRNDAITDSKKLSPVRRNELFKVIEKDALSIGVGIVQHYVIDKINILQATLLAMEKALGNLTRIPDYILIDGINSIRSPITQRTVIKGDSLSITIAAASIIAKVTRDGIMTRYHDRYPQYNFQRNKGYPTKEHREAIERHGICEIHRRSFSCRTKTQGQG